MIPFFEGLLKSNLSERLRPVTVSHSKYYSVFTNRSQALYGMQESTHTTLLSNREWCLPTGMPHPSAITCLNNHHFHIITVGLFQTTAIKGGFSHIVVISYAGDKELESFSNPLRRSLRSRMSPEQSQSGRLCKVNAVFLLGTRVISALQANSYLKIEIGPK